MKIIEDNNRVILQGIRDFHPDHTFDNGQCFRWNKESDGSYTGVAFGKIVNIESANGAVILNNVTKEDYLAVWEDYLDLNRDYEAIKRFLSENDPEMRKAIGFGGGMRILKQDPWEMVISFIISQNNNIPRIKKCVEGLCANYGKQIGTYRGKVYYSFPTPEDLSGLTAQDLDICKLGYRAKYIVETAGMVASDGGAALMQMVDADPGEAYEYLMGLSGVGPKVANCIMLFGLRKYASFPLDVWIKRVMHEVYGIEENNTVKMQEYAEKHFGSLGGIAQQYLFYYARETSKKKYNEATGGIEAC